ncbi:hydrolase activity protein [[Candida] boidinii]|nr:hydrolase activity protein [[Candida] boidinii]
MDKDQSSRNSGRLLNLNMAKKEEIRDERGRTRAVSDNPEMERPSNATASPKRAKLSRTDSPFRNSRSPPRSPGRSPTRHSSTKSYIRTRSPNKFASSARSISLNDLPSRNRSSGLNLASAKNQLEYFQRLKSPDIKIPEQTSSSFKHSDSISGNSPITNASTQDSNILNVVSDDNSDSIKIPFISDSVNHEASAFRNIRGLETAKTQVGFTSGSTISNNLKKESSIDKKSSKKISTDSSEPYVLDKSQNTFNGSVDEDKSKDDKERIRGINKIFRKIDNRLSPPTVDKLPVDALINGNPTMDSRSPNGEILNSHGKSNAGETFLSNTTNNMNKSNNNNNNYISNNSSTNDNHQNQQQIINRGNTQEANGTNNENKEDDHADEASLTKEDLKKKISKLKKFRVFSFLIVTIVFFSAIILMVLVTTYAKSDIAQQNDLFRYFGSLKPDERVKEISSLMDEFSIDKTELHIHGLDIDTAKKVKSLNFSTNFNSNIFKPQIAENWQDTLNNFENINEKYRNDQEIKKLMNNDNLHNVFHGISYAPRNVIEPMCGVNSRDVMLDLALLSQLTTRVRTYGTQCNQAEHVLNAIQDLNLNMSLALGVWIGPNDYSNWKQINNMKLMLSAYPREYFDSIYVGNEVLFREEKSTEELISYIEEVKSFVNNIGYSDLPVGASEIGALINPELVQACDFVGANIHPFFGGTTVEQASSWSKNFLNYQVEPIRDSILDEIDVDDEGKANKKKIAISEIGWPYCGGTFIEAHAGDYELQYFLDDWICRNEHDYDWFWFEAFDEPWKKIWHEENSKWETEWGIFTSDRELKENIQIPNCDSEEYVNRLNTIREMKAINT